MSMVYDEKDHLVDVCVSQLRNWWEAWTGSEDFRRRFDRAQDRR